MTITQWLPTEVPRHPRVPFTIYKLPVEKSGNAHPLEKHPSDAHARNFGWLFASSITVL